MRLAALYCAAVLAVLATREGRAQSSGERPFYAIAHAINDPDWIAPALKRGANGIEIDISCRNGVFSVAHDVTGGAGFPVGEFMQKLSFEAKASGRMVLLILDIKNVCGDQDGVVRLMRAVRENLTADLNVIYSVSTFAKAPWLTRIVTHAKITLGAREALAIDEEDDYARVAQVFRDAGVTQYAFGLGTFVFNPNLGRNSRIEKIVTEAASARERLGFRFVYIWTLRRNAAMKRMIGAGVDGIMVNASEVDDLLKAAQAANRRLAIRADRPFAP